MPPKIERRDLLWLLLLTAAAILIHGYHVGVEDQAIYLPAIKKNLDPGLYPHDASFFLAQAGPTLFDELVAGTVRWSGLPLEWALLAWHVISVFLILLGARQLTLRLFPDTVAQWAGVAMTTVMLGLPVAGTRLHITAEYLHPRNLATAALLFALVAVLDGRVTAIAWMAVMAVLHPQMAVFGVYHLVFQAMGLPQNGKVLAALPPIDSAGEAWREVMSSRQHHFPLRWHWYEQLGAVAPPLLLAWFARLGRKLDAPLLAHVSGRSALSGSLAVAGAVVITVVPGFERLIPVQSMRSLHFVYILLFLLGGGLLGQFVLRNRLRWILLFVPLVAVMAYAGKQLYPASPHIEWPGAAPRAAWLQAFDWVRQNTPRDALFALDPRYMERPGEDNHGFRAFAERSMLADYFKDRGLSAIFSDQALQADLEVRARQNWRTFGADDFRRLRKAYGATWVIVERPGVAGLPCPYANEKVLVCQIE